MTGDLSTPGTDPVISHSGNAIVLFGPEDMRQIMLATARSGLDAYEKYLQGGPMAGLSDLAASTKVLIAILEAGR
jgi:hypothetical protein